MDNTTAGEGKGRCFVRAQVDKEWPVSAVCASPAPGVERRLDAVRALQHALYRAAKVVSRQAPPGLARDIEHRR
jgi:hypothetical protein